MRLLGIFAVLLLGCGGGAGPGSTDLVGTIILLNDGAGYGLLTDDGAAYEPRNLPAEFEVNGIRIRCDATILDDEGDWGKPIEVTDVEHVWLPVPGRTIVFTGTVTWVQLEGGFWGIVAEDGKQYDPLNLPAEFAVEGLRVIVAGTVRDDLAHFHMWGELILIDSIERAE